MMKNPIILMVVPALLCASGLWANDRLNQELRLAVLAGNVALWSISSIAGPISMRGMMTGRPPLCGLLETTLARCVGDRTGRYVHRRSNPTQTTRCGTRATPPLATSTARGR